MNLKKTLVTAGIAALLCGAAHDLMAQDNGGAGGGAGGGLRRGGGGGFGGGNFDPAEMQQRMMENIRDQMSITNDEEWNVIQGRIQKVVDARRDVGGPNFGRLFRRRNNDGDNNGGGGGGGGRRGGLFGTPSPELESLQNAIDNNAPSEQVKAALEKYRAARKAKEAALEKAQDDLKSVLTLKQEAAAVSLGLIN